MKHATSQLISTRCTDLTKRCTDLAKGFGSYSQITSGGAFHVFSHPDH
jgi:hypothetical protein